MTKSAKLIQIENELEDLRKQIKAKEDERAAELSRIEVAFVTSTLSKHLKNGDFVKVTGARSGLVRRVVQLHDEGGWLTAQVFSAPKGVSTKELHNLRFCGIELCKVSHVNVDNKWVKVRDYVEQYRTEPPKG
jgi:hypothetical protein